jgi:hypothetical protein
MLAPTMVQKTVFIFHISGDKIGAALKEVRELEGTFDDAPKPQTMGTTTTRVLETS